MDHLSGAATRATTRPAASAQAIAAASAAAAPTTRTGRCLCGAVELSLRLPADRAECHACHCEMCRRWSGGPLLVVNDATDVVVEAADGAVTVFNSSDWAERGFCSTCGSHLFYRLKEAGSMHVPVGLLDDLGSFRLAEQMFVDLKPAFYSFAEPTFDMTEAEVLARFASPAPPSQAQPDR